MAFTGTQHMGANESFIPPEHYITQFLYPEYTTSMLNVLPDIGGYNFNYLDDAEFYSVKYHPKNKNDNFVRAWTGDVSCMNDHHCVRLNQLQGFLKNSLSMGCGFKAISKMNEYKNCSPDLPDVVHSFVTEEYIRLNEGMYNRGMTYEGQYVPLFMTFDHFNKNSHCAGKVSIDPVILVPPFYNMNRLFQDNKNVVPMCEYKNSSFQKIVCSI